MGTSPLQKILRIIELEDERKRIDSEIRALTAAVKYQIERQERDPELSVVRGQS